jgi:hypothetical protein
VRVCVCACVRACVGCSSFSRHLLSHARSGCRDSEKAVDTNAFDPRVKAGAVSYLFVLACSHGLATSYESLLKLINNALSGSPDKAIVAAIRTERDSLERTVRARGLPDSPPPADTATDPATRAPLRRIERSGNAGPLPPAPNPPLREDTEQLRQDEGAASRASDDVSVVFASDPSHAVVAAVADADAVVSSSDPSHGPAASAAASAVGGGGSAAAASAVGGGGSAAAASAGDRPARRPTADLRRYLAASTYSSALSGAQPSAANALLFAGLAFVAPAGAVRVAHTHAGPDLAQVSAASASPAPTIAPSSSSSSSSFSAAAASRAPAKVGKPWVPPKFAQRSQLCASSPFAPSEPLHF